MIERGIGVRRFLSIVTIGCLLLLLLPAKGVEAGSAISNLQIGLVDNVVDRPVNYFIYFRSNSLLRGGGDNITVVFPKEVDISPQIKGQNVAINDQEVSGVNYNADSQTLLIPVMRDIASGETVSIGIASAVIRNPKIAGNYQIRVFTSQEQTEVTSPFFYITDYEYSNGVSKPTVELSSTAGENAPAYAVKFKTSVNGELIGGRDKIYLNFIGAQMPASISGNKIEINGHTLTDSSVSIDGRTVTLMLPWEVDIEAGGNVEIKISAQAGIEASYNENNTLQVSTSVETREIVSFPFSRVEQTTTIPDKEKRIHVLVEPAEEGQVAAYTINIKANSLKLYVPQAEASGMTLIFPNGTLLPESIGTEDIKVNGCNAAGVLSDKTRNQILFTLQSSIRLNQDITVSIAKTAGIKNPPHANYKLDIGALNDSSTTLSDSYDILETGTTPIAANPILTGEERITLEIDNPVANVNGRKIVLDAAPIIKNNVTLVPLRFLAGSLGATTEYYADGSYVEVKHNGKEMTLWLNSCLAKVQGQFISLAEAATIINGRMMVPIRFISENFGAHVNWDGITRTITIAQDDIEQTDTKCYLKTGNSYSNLRVGPGTDYAIAGRVLPGQPMTVLLTQGDWFKVRLETGLEAWIANWMVDAS